MQCNGIMHHSVIIDRFVLFSVFEYGQVWMGSRWILSVPDSKIYHPSSSAAAAVVADIWWLISAPSLPSLAVSPWLMWNIWRQAPVMIGGAMSCVIMQMFKSEEMLSIIATIGNSFNISRRLTPVSTHPTNPTPARLHKFAASYTWQSSSNILSMLTTDCHREKYAKLLSYFSCKTFNIQ